MNSYLWKKVYKINRWENKLNPESWVSIYKNRFDNFFHFRLMNWSENKNIIIYKGKTLKETIKFALKWMDYRQKIVSWQPPKKFRIELYDYKEI